MGFTAGRTRWRIRGVKKLVILMFTITGFSKITLIKKIITQRQTYMQCLIKQPHSMKSLFFITFCFLHLLGSIFSLKWLWSQPTCLHIQNARKKKAK